MFSMSDIRKYAFFHFKKSLIRLAVAAIVGLILVDSFVLDVYYTTGRSGDKDHYLYISFTTFFLFFSFLAMVMPILELHPFHNRCALDTFFSIPCKRSSLLLTHIFNGALQILIILILTCTWTAIRFIKFPEIEVFNMLPFFIGILSLSLAFYFINCFAFLTANRIIDGVILTLLFIGVPLALLVFMIEIADSLGRFSETEFFNLSAPLNMMILTEYFEDLFSDSNWRIDNAVLSTGVNLGILFTIFLGLAAIVLCVWLFKKKKAEKAGAISDAWWGYPFLIPFLGFNLVIYFGSFLWGVLVGIMAFIGYVIYRRSARLKIHEWILIGAITILGCIPENLIKLLLP